MDSDELEGTFVVFGGGTGVFCFLDFVAFTLRYMCNKISLKMFNEENNRINNEDFSKVNENFKLIYFSSFSDEDSAIYIDVCKQLHTLNESYKLNVFNFYSRISSKDKSWNKTFIENILVKEKNIKKIFLCGPTGFLTDIKNMLLQIDIVSYKDIHLV